jgi:bifunctional non-homologous end joining protein LigD
MADKPPFTVAFPEPPPLQRDGQAWVAVIDGRALKLSNLDKPYWAAEGYTKADVVGYYHAVARWILPYLRDRPLTLKRMPEGADGEFFYAKRAPDYTPDWVQRAPVTSRDSGKTIEYLLAQDRPSLLWLANLGCIEMHPWHSRADEIGRPDYAFFDLDPMGAEFATVREVALLVRTVLDQLGLRGYPRTSGATGMQVYVPIDRVHSYAAVREWVGTVCRLINRADPERTTMEWSIADRTGKVFLDHNMNTEGRNIAATYSLRPERAAPVATPLRWEEVDGDVEPADFTIATIWARLEAVGDLFAPVLEGGQDLRSAMAAVGMDAEEEPAPAGHTAELVTYTAKRDFTRTPEPAADGPTDGEPGHRFVIQHHLATRLHHDLRLEHDGALPSWAVPKGLPDVPGVRHLAVQTEDHPLGYLDFEGEIPSGEYGGGPVRIWDRGTYEASEWIDDKVTFTLHGKRHRGTFHLFRTDPDKPDQWLVIRRDEPEPDELPPLPPKLSPMLAASHDAGAFDDPDWLFEVKWDGVRVIATTQRPGAGEDGRTVLVSRQGNDVTAAYPELASLWERVLARNAVLDGEVVSFSADGVPSFQRLQRRMHVREPAMVERLRRQAPVTLVVFDVLAVDGRLLTDRPLVERLAVLDDLLVPGAAVQRSEPVAEHGRALYDAARERGLEGIMAKRASSTYQPGRRAPDWRKIKVRRTGEVVVGGWLPGEGGRSGKIGSLLVGCYDGEGHLRFSGRVGTGFTEAELERVEGLLAPLAAEESPFATPPAPPRDGRWVRPELVCAVEYSEVTEAGSLRAPAYKGMVAGRDARACLRDDLAATR